VKLIFFTPECVLIPAPQGVAQRLPDGNCVKRLNSLCLLTGASLVVIGERRQHHWSMLLWELQAVGVVGEVVPVAAVHATLGEEVPALLDSMRDWGITSYVILTDQHLEDPHLVQIDRTRGLTDQDVSRALGLLEGWL
jgi:hypothetical protein